MRVFVCLCLALTASLGWGQQEWVELERAQAQLALAREELHRWEALAREGLVSEVELSRQRAQVRMAELGWREALWQFQGSRFRVVVADSIRSTGADGLDTITLVLELPPLGQPSVALVAETAQLGVADLLVLLVDKGVVVGFPYSQVVPYLSPGAKATVSFQLLRPVETPTVVLEYRGTREEITLYPRVASDRVPVRLFAAQPSLTVTFGDEARFSLTFEPLQRRTLSLELEVRGLPPVCRLSFREGQSGATVSSLLLSAGSGPKGLELAVQLPPGPVGEVRLGQPLHLVVVGRYEVDGGKGEVTQDLQLTPVGVPQLELRASSWLVEALAGREVRVPVEVINVGSAPAHAVGVQLEFPPELSVRLEPSDWQELGVGEKTRSFLWVQVTDMAAAGEYLVRLKPTLANNSFVRGDSEGQLRIRVRSARPWMWPLVLGGALCGIILLVWRGMRHVRLE